MRNGFVKAQIQWLPYGLGGRRVPPTGETYAGTLSFTNNVSDLWSFFMENYISPSQPMLVHDVDLTLMIEAKRLELLPGREFSCYEGSRLVAKGKILIL